MSLYNGPNYLVVKLSCGHEVDTPASNATSQEARELCPTCDTQKRIVAIWEYGKLQCHTCHKVSKLYGYNVKQRVEKIVQKHSNKYPAHLVACYVNGKLLYQCTQAIVQPELPLTYLDPTLPAPQPPPF